MYTDKKLMESMNHVNNIELKPNQRIKTDKRTNVTWLEERRSWKDCGGCRHNCWMRVAIVG